MLKLSALFTLLAAPALATGLEIEVAGEANGTITVDLLEDVAPGHVEQITELAREGAYDNVVFHRVIDGFMAQTGDPT
ncbi:MAG: peptidylprolyl isomerase, partial [Roseovarius confluentis]